MADITKCHGKGCFLAQRCYRFTAPGDDTHQSWFKAPPVRHKLDDDVCDYFWDVENK